MQISKEFKIGLFSVITIAMLYLGFNFLKGVDFFSTTNQYYAIYQNINGLKKSNSVIINGLAIGRVSNIIFQQQKQNRIIVEMSIESNIILDDSTTAYLISEGFLGEKAIELKIPRVIDNPLKSGDTLKSEVAKGLIESLTDQSTPVADDASALFRKFNSLLDSLILTEFEIRKTFITADSTLKITRSAFQENRTDLNESIANFKMLTVKLNESATILNSTLTKTGMLVDTLNNLELKKAVDNIVMAGNSLNEIMRNIGDGEGTAGKLITDDSLYLHLAKSAEDLDKLLVDLRENPKKYVHFSIFGGKDNSSKEN